MSSTRLFFVVLMLLSGCIFTPIEPPPVPCHPPVLAGPPAGDVPANWPLFAVSYPASSNPGMFDWSNVGLRRVSDGSMVPGVADPTPLPGVDSSRVVRAFVPWERLVPGEDYDFFQPFCRWTAEDPPITRYHTVAPIAEPTVLGTIEVSQIYAANAIRGLANRMYFIVVTLTPDPATAIEPWATSMKWTAVEVVDGTESWLLSSFGRVDLRSARRISMWCDSPFTGYDGIRPGPRTLRGTTGYDTAVRISTPDIAIVIDSCESALRVDNETLEPLTPEEIAFWDTE